MNQPERAPDAWLIFSTGSYEHAYEGYQSCKTFAVDNGMLFGGSFFGRINSPYFRGQPVAGGIALENMVGLDEWNASMDIWVDQNFRLKLIAKLKAAVLPDDAHWEFQEATPP